MTSWRDNTTEQTQTDVDEMVDAALNAAQQLLAENGEFLPFGLAVGSDGVLRAFGVDESVLPPEPASKDVVQALHAGFASGRGELRAAAVVADVLLKDGGRDAINVSLEHSEGPAMNVQLPYSRDGDSADIDYGEASATPGRRRIWGE